jgi:putative protease
LVRHGKKAIDEDGITACATVAHPKEQAKKDAAALQTFRAQLSRTGETEFAAREITYTPAVIYFLPTAILNRLRRDCLEALRTQRSSAFTRAERRFAPTDVPYPTKVLDRHANVVNEKARAFYHRHGVTEIEDGVELRRTDPGTILMTSKYCLKYQFGLCSGKHGNPDPLYLSDGKRRYRVEFDCERCEMRIVDPRAGENPGSRGD